MANTRLRKTFAYPDSDSDSEPEGIDEQEQEELITQLIETDAQKTENYKRAFLVLPLLSVILYVPSLTIANLHIHLLAITSLLSSAYATWIIPSRSAQPPASSTSTTLPLGKLSRVPDGGSVGPLKKYIDHLNAGTCVILALQALRAKKQDLSDEMWLAVLPSIVFLLLYLARSQLRPVDVRELEKLRYGYKGA